jgi:DNA-binding protein YbaB
VFDFEADLDAAERRVNDWQSAIDQRAREARAVAERLAGLSATSRSRDGLVGVTVGSSGTVSGITLDERIRAQPAAETARQILVVMRQAQADLARQVAEATAASLDPGSDTGRAIVDLYARQFGSAEL